MQMLYFHMRAGSEKLQFSVKNQNQPKKQKHDNLHQLTHASRGVGTSGMKSLLIYWKSVFLRQKQPTLFTGMFLGHCLHAGALFWNHECTAEQNEDALKGRLRRQHLWITLFKILHWQRLDFGLCAKQRDSY